MRLRPLLLLPLLLALAACETGPRERTVSARFACEDGREMRAVFNLDARTAALRIGKKETAILAADGPTGLAYSGDGYALKRLGDRATLTTPTAPAASCLETR